MGKKCSLANSLDIVPALDCKDVPSLARSVHQDRVAMQHQATMKRDVGLYDK